MTAAEPAVKTASAYYAANIGYSEVDQRSRRQLSAVVLRAQRLWPRRPINAKGLITKVLEGGGRQSEEPRNTLPNAQWKAFAAAFNFVDSGATPPSSTSAVATTTSDYVEQQLESDQGDQTSALSLRSIFQRVAPTVTSEVGILADPNLLQVAATIMGLPPAAAADLQPQTLSELMPLSDLKDPAKLTQLTERFNSDVAITPTVPAPARPPTSRSDSGNSSSGQSGAAAVPRQRDQLERFRAGQRAQRLHRRNPAGLLDCPDVEHVAAYAGRVSSPPGLYSP